METGAAVFIAGIATILAIHTLRDPEHARRYARFLVTGTGPNGRRIVGDTGGALNLDKLDALPGFTATPTPAPARTPAPSRLMRI